MKKAVLESRDGFCCLLTVLSSHRYFYSNRYSALRHRFVREPKNYSPAERACLLLYSHFFAGEDLKARYAALKMKTGWLLSCACCYFVDLYYPMRFRAVALIPDAAEIPAHCQCEAADYKALSAFAGDDVEAEDHKEESDQQ